MAAPGSKLSGERTGSGVRIVALADMRNSIDSRPKKLIYEFSRAELIIHAGGFTSKRLVDDGEVQGKLSNFER